MNKANLERESPCSQRTRVYRRTSRAEASCCWVRSARMRNVFKTDPKEEELLSIKTMGHTPFWHVLFCPGMGQRMSHASLSPLHEEQENRHHSCSWERKEQNGTPEGCPLSLVSAPFRGEADLSRHTSERDGHLCDEATRPLPCQKVRWWDQQMDAFMASEHTSSPIHQC